MAMSHDITVTFLGTASGGGPSESRNCSSLVVDALGDGSLWMVDCAEGTVRQVLQQPFRGADRLKLSKLAKVLVTHMHADHTAGILTLLRNTLGIPKPDAHSRSPHAPELQHAPPLRTDPPRIEIYGPRGLRRFLRLQMLLTHTRSQDRYAVHELLTRDETPSCASDLPPSSAPGADQEARLSENEAPGRDIRCDAQGFWRQIIVEDAGNRGNRWWDAGGVEHRGTGRVVVDAGPIDHRDPCIGYVICEVPIQPHPAALQNPIPIPRKLVILGDTSNSDGLIPLVDPPFPWPSSHLSNTAHASGSATDPIEVDLDVDMDVPPGDASVGIDVVIPPKRTPVSLLIHEATDAYIPTSIDPNEKTGRNRTTESVEAKTRDRGHSTPAVAGAFARKIGAERVVLNHIGARFPAPSLPPRAPWEKFQLACLREIERQAHAAWDPPKSNASTYVTAAYDYYQIVVPPNKVPRPEEYDDPMPRERSIPRREPARVPHELRTSGQGGEHLPAWFPRHPVDIAQPRPDPEPEPQQGTSDNRMPPFVRQELALQTRARWEALASQGSLVSEVSYTEHLEGRSNVAEHENRYGGTVSGKRERASSSDSHTAQVGGGRGRGSRGGRGGARGMHTQAQDDLRGRGRGRGRGQGRGGYRGGENKRGRI